MFHHRRPIGEYAADLAATVSRQTVVAASIVGTGARIRSVN